MYFLLIEHGDVSIHFHVSFQACFYTLASRLILPKNPKGMFTNIYHRNLPIGGKIAFQIPTIPFSGETGWWFQPI